ncbi:MAG TPA: C45 family peptidase [Rhizomicrobium sp.]
MELASTPRNNGRMHGEALRDKIAGILELWRATTVLPAGLSFQDFIELFLAETCFTDRIRHHMPSLMEEIAGIADGANQPPDLVLAFQFGDEARWYLRDRFAEPARGDRCSSLGAVGDARGATVVAQNIDVGAWADGAQAVLRLRDGATGGETLIFTVAGMIGMNGLSGSGIGLCCNTLLQLDPDPAGLPVAAIVRRTLASRNFEEAAEFLRTVPHASGQNYLLAGRHDVVNFECSAGGAVPFRLDGRSDRVVHTNHPLVSPFTARFAAWRERAPDALDQTLETSSLRRLQSLKARFASSRGPCSADEAKAALRARDDLSYPVCREAVPDGWMTIGATVFEIGGDAVMHVAPGAPSQCEFLALSAAPSA